MGLCYPRMQVENNLARAYLLLHKTVDINVLVNNLSMTNTDLSAKDGCWTDMAVSILSSIKGPSLLPCYRGAPKASTARTIYLQLTSSGWATKGLSLLIIGLKVAGRTMFRSRSSGDKVSSVMHHNVLFAFCFNDFNDRFAVPIPGMSTLIYPRANSKLWQHGSQLLDVRVKLRGVWGQPLISQDSKFEPPKGNTALLLSPS